MRNHLFGHNNRIACVTKVMLCLGLIFCLKQAGAQETTVFRINKEKGLSSDHVYFTKPDRLGYLWIGTTDGLYRYNGYEFKKYDYDDGLPNTDVWDLTEDTKGRLWVHSIAPVAGYIRDNRYKQIPFAEKNELKVVYPLMIDEYGDSTYFVLRTVTEKGVGDYGIIYNDTFYLERVKINSESKHVHFFNGKVIELADVGLGRVYSIRDELNGKARPPVVPVNAEVTKKIVWSQITLRFVDKLFLFEPRDTCVRFYDINNDSLRKIVIRDINGNARKIEFAIPNKDTVYAFAGGDIYAIDSGLIIRSKYDINKLFPGVSGNNANVINFINDRYWGKCVSTSTSGVFMKVARETSIHSKDLGLGTYRYANTDNGIGYWWSDEQHKLKMVKGDSIVKSVTIKGAVDVHRVRTINENLRFINTINKTLIEKDGKILSPYSVFLRLHEKGKFVGEAFNELVHMRYMIDCIPVNDSTFYQVSTGIIGLNRVKISMADSTLYSVNIDKVRYQSGYYNDKLKMAVFSEKNRLMIINDKTLETFSVGYDVLGQYDIRGIENAVLDDYGNVFVKSFDRLNVYNIYTHRLKRIFKSYNLEHTKFDLTGNTLSLAGPLGVIRCDVSGMGTISNVRNYPNVKNIYYSSVADAQFSTGGVLLNTDKGTFFVNTESSKDSLQEDFHAYLISYEDTVRQIQMGDTVYVPSSADNIDLDIIRPVGSGNWGCRYFTETAKYRNQGRKLQLQGLKPDLYHKIVLTFYDDSWVGRPVTIFVYIEPLWWQRDIAKVLMLIGVILLLLGLVYLIIVITRRVVNDKNEKRNQQSNLELKSIHSQINPHFIFNTLSTALYYVNNNENENAFRHISQFSELLQAYIKSSRNKYISISDELDNIENYLELQLSRFEDKFTYDIRVDERINADKVKIPSLILQPIVENALNHGIFHKEGPGRIELTFDIDEKDSKVLVIKVDDDGVGRQKSKNMRSTLLKKADSYGSILIKELVDVFNKYEKINISVDYIDKQEPSTGTTVVIKIKNYEHAQ